jgi:uncharacterized membrane protein YoaK (UPF0700 family)
METQPEEARKNQLKSHLHHIMAVVGGFMAGYAILNRSDFLGNAQTTNWIYLVFALFGRNFFEAMLRVVVVFLYVAGCMTYVFIKNKTHWNIQRVSVLIDAIAVLILGFIPSTASPVISLYPIFFAMAFQWNAFSGSYGYVSSTIFSTNNTRQMALAFAEFLCNHDRNYLHKLGFFAASLVSFHIGVTAAYFSTKYFQIHAIYFVWVILIPALALIQRLEMETTTKKEDLSEKLKEGIVCQTQTNY